LLRQDGDSLLSSFIRVVFNSYVQAYNVWYKRSGTLFEGRFKHIEVDKDSYILQLCRYIHLNPVLAGIVERPEDWDFSDYREWIGQAKSNSIDKEFISRYFPTPKDYEKFVMEYLEEKRKDNAFSKYLFD
jgi:putative transposase